MKFVLENLARTIDNAIDEGDKKTIDQSLSEIGALLDTELSKIEKANLHFFSANCYASKRHIERDINEWTWEDEYLEKEIYHLRLSLSECIKIPMKEDLTDLRFRVGTNLANALNHVGRFVEAIEAWDEVIWKHPKYSMALGNKGYCLSWYARYLYDPGHQRIFFNESYHNIKNALNIGVENHARESMSNWLDQLMDLGDWENFEFSPKNESRGRSKKEREYRSWCINNRLFLNPLNDIWEHDVVANDVLTFPSIVAPIEGRSKENMFPEVYAIYNQLKQEYASTRYVMHEAIQESNEKLHFSDKRVKLYDMLDYRKYQLWIEKLKMSFLSAYAIFDKIAYLINEYWDLSVDVRRVKFNTIWNKSGCNKQKLSEVFSGSDNWPLRGLYWLSKDLYFKKSDHHPIEPDAKHLNHIRNHIAHKYLCVYCDWASDIESLRKNKGHHLSYPIGDKEFISQSVKLLKLVRSALIYLSLAAHAQESKSRIDSDRDFFAPMELIEIDDEFR